MRESAAKLTPTLLLFTTVGGGLYFGLFSCGGYVWHRQLHFLSMLLLSLLLLLAPPRRLLKPWRRAIFVAVSLTLFVAVRGAASAFYPVPPESVHDFLDVFETEIRYDLC